MKKRITSLFCTLVILFTNFAFMIPVGAIATKDGNATVVSKSEIPLVLKYDEEALAKNENSPSASMHVDTTDIGWNNWSLPIGNGYFGVNVFGRTETERIQITEKTLSNPWRATGPNGESISNLGGLNNFSETYIDFGHTNSELTDYERYLDLKTAISGVGYTYNGVKYTREYFASYPDKALVIKLDADTAGALSFTLRPTVPYEQTYAVMEGDRGGKHGTVISSVENGVGNIVLSGALEYYDVDFMGIYKVYTDGGTVSASTVTNADGDTDGTIVVNGADSAFIVVTLGTDYELSSEVFTAGDSQKPTHKTTIEDTKKKVEGYMDAINKKLSNKTYADAYGTLKSAHIADHSELFGRVSLDLGCDSADFDRTTDELLSRYESGIHSTYLETLVFQYGRYLLIASSRSGALPAHLQGAWNTYNISPWASGYWHNINVQMNYWHAFSTNLAETFDSYVQFNAAYMEQAKAYADSVINSYNNPAYDGTGNNGWTIGVGNTAFSISSDRSPGNAGYTTQLFWDYYRYTKDEKILNEVVLPVLLEAAKFITKCVEKTEDGYYLVSRSDSPEMFVNGVWYYTKGTTYAQTFAYLNNYNTLLAAEKLGIVDDGKLVNTDSKYAILKNVLDQITLYDPINVGLSGQIKEFREEDYYGSVGDEPNHRHISQLVGLAPGNLINANTPAWLDAALVTLDGRSQADAHGWVFAHKINLYARAFDSANAYSMLNGFIGSCVQNLWSVYNNRIFQVEANFGTTAGIAEMLMQSHNGYIELLPAITEKWADGKFTGLVAEDNFEVSASWNNGLINTVNIISNKGERVAVKYPSIANAIVVSASDGKSVPFSVTGKDIITFDTKSGENYIISGFEKIVAPEAPSSVEYTREDFGSFNISCSAVENAIRYNLYVAVENSPVYTLVKTSTNPKFVYSPAKENVNSRTTFAVTALNANGAESKRTLCYYNPKDTNAGINDIYVSYLANGTLQVIVDANDNAAKYKLWEKENNGSFNIIDESIFPLLTYKNYNSDHEYAVSVVSGFDGKESELKLLDSDYKPNNVLLGKDFIPTEETKNNVYIYGGEPLGFDLLTDGKHTEEIVGRFSSSKNGKIDATINLGATYILSELRFKLYKGNIAESLGNNPSAFKVHICSGGKWITVFDGSTQNIDDYKVGSTPYIVFNLGCAKVEKIRFEAQAINNKTVTFHEIECSGILARKYKYETENLLAGTTFVPTAETKNNVYDYNGYKMGFDLLTDGEKNQEITGRFSSVRNVSVEATVSLNGIYALSELRVYLYAGDIANAGQSFKLDILQDGEWITIFSGGQTDLSKHLNDRYLSFDMGYAAAEKIRFSATALDSSKTVTFYEIECSGFEIEKYEFEELENNVLSGKEFVPTQEAYNQVYKGNQNYGYKKLTDGAGGGRFSTNSGTGLFDATIDLGGIYSLNDLRIRYYVEGSNTTSFVGSSMLIQVFADGKWNDVVDCKSSSSIISYRDTSLSDFWACFNLGGTLAEKIRIYVPSAQGTKYSISYYEIEASARKLKENSDVEDGENVFTEATMNVPLESQYAENILLGKPFVPTSSANAQIYNANYGYAKLTDGGSGRFSTKTSTGFVDATLDLGAVYELNSLRIQYYTELPNKAEFDFVGTALTIELYRNGTWETAVSCKTNSEIAAHKASNYWLDFDLSGKQAEKIRIYIPSTVSAGSGRSISLYEIECSGSELIGGAISSENTVSNMTDGKTDTYLEVLDTNTYTVEIELPSPRALTTLNVYEFIEDSNLINGVLSTASNSTDIEVFKGGYWVKIYDNVSLGDRITSFDMYGVECSKIRITFENTRLFDNESVLRSAKISEISCIATSKTLDYTEMKAALNNFPNSAANSKTYRQICGYILNLKATQSEIDAYTSEINEYCRMITDVDFTPRSSITLGSDLVYNIYIPVTDILKSFTIDGVAYENAETVVLDDGSSYYRIKVPMAASEAARNIVLKASVTVNGKNYTGNWTMSITKYAKSVIESGTAEEVTLVKDVLAYIRAAYVYFDADGKDEAVATIGEILGDYNNVFAKVEGSTDVDNGLWGVVIVLEEKPAIRFVLPEGVTADNYKFKSGNRTLEYTIGTMTIEGKTHIYAEVSLYAYQLINEVTYTDGTNSGTWHINSYYDFVTTDNEHKDDKNLISLVEKLYNYCKSAEIYRASVTSK